MQAAAAEVPECRGWQRRWRRPERPGWVERTRRGFDEMSGAAQRHERGRLPSGGRGETAAAAQVCRRGGAACGGGGGGDDSGGGVDPAQGGMAYL
eukprot:4395915-Prymnesium_polylepis.1